MKNKKSDLANRTCQVRSKGFTLIEMIVAIAVISLIMPTVFEIFYAIMRQQIRIYRLSEIKRQGDYVLSVLETTIRNNAISTHTAQAVSSADEICKNADSTSSPSRMYFRDKSGGWFSFSLTSNQVASDSASTNRTLTTDKVRIEGLSISCTRSALFSTPVVGVGFKICYRYSAVSTCSTAPNRIEEVATLDYRTNVKLRNQ